jgi:hypothetical protein
MDSSKMTFRQFSGLDGLTALKNDWKQLVKHVSDDQYLHAYEWHLSYMQALLARGVECFYYCAYIDKQPVAIFPFCREKSNTKLITLNYITLPQHSHITLHDFILHDEILCERHIVEYLMAAIKADGIKWDYLLFASVIEGSKAQLQLDYESYPLTIKKIIDDSYSIDLSNTYEETISHLPGNFRRNIARLERKALKQGELDFIQIKLDNQQGPDYLEQFIDIENDSWKGKNSSSIKSNQKYIDYYNYLMRNFSSDSYGVINFLQQNNELIAGQFAIYHKNRLNLLKIGYRESHSGIGPGNILLSYTLRDCVENSDCTNVNIITSPKWADKWYNNNKKVYSYYLFNRTLKGYSLYLVSRHVVPTVKKARSVANSLYKSAKSKFK